MRYYAGLDVSSATTMICVEDQEGRIVFEQQVPTEPTAIRAALDPFVQTLETVGLESGGMSHWLTDQLKQQKLPVTCIDARAMSTLLSAKRNKNDRNDARGIAKAMRTQHYQAVHPKSVEAQTIKTVLTTRAQLVKQRTQLTNTMRGLLRSRGIRLQSGKTPFKQTFANFSLDSYVMTCLTLLQASFTAVETQLCEINRLVTDLATNPKVILLMTIPSIGPITALSYLAEIDDPTRFDNSRNVAAYLGLTPRQYQSGTTNRLGKISKRGPTQLRYLLTEAGLVLLTRVQASSKLKAWGLRLSKRIGPKPAATAVGRKLAVLMHRMLITNEPFRYSDRAKK